MPLTINQEIFDRVKTAITERGRINMMSWAEAHGSVMAESVDEIRGLSLLDNCQVTACIGGLTCYLTTSEEIARAVETYDLSDSERHIDEHGRDDAPTRHGSRRDRSRIACHEQ